MPKRITTSIMQKKKVFESWEETIYLNTIPGLVSSILEADKEKLEDCTKHEDIEW